VEEGGVLHGKLRYQACDDHSVLSRHEVVLRRETGPRKIYQTFTEQSRHPGRALDAIGPFAHHVVKSRAIDFSLSTFLPLSEFSTPYIFHNAQLTPDNSFTVMCRARLSDVANTLVSPVSMRKSHGSVRIDLDTSERASSGRISRRAFPQFERSQLI
jgi:hypothetical protein